MNTGANLGIYSIPSINEESHSNSKEGNLFIPNHKFFDIPLVLNSSNCKFILSLPSEILLNSENFGITQLGYNSARVIASDEFDLI